MSDALFQPQTLNKVDDFVSGTADEFVGKHDVIVVRPEQDNADSTLIKFPSNFYRRYVSNNQDAISYIVYQGFQTRGRGLVALIPLWENRNDPKVALLYVSKTNLSQVPLLGTHLSKAYCFPRWYISMSELARSQLLFRLATYDPQTEAVVLAQVEDISQVFPIEEVYRQIHSVEIFTFSDFHPSIISCYERFKHRSVEFIL